MAALARLLQQHAGAVPGPDVWTGFLNDLVQAITVDTQEVVELANAAYELKLSQAHADLVKFEQTNTDAEEKISDAQ